MAVTRYTLTGDFGDIVGDEFNQRSVKAFLSTNLPAGQALVNLADNEIQIGARELALDTSGSFSVSLIASNSADTNIASGTLEYRVTFSYVNPATRTRDTWDSGYFELTADADLSDVAGTIAAPIAWRTAFIADMEAIQAAAEAARDAAVDISGISTSDGVVEALIKGAAGAGPLTRAALSASTARSAGVNLLTYGSPSGVDDRATFEAALAAMASSGIKRLIVPNAGTPWTIDAGTSPTINAPTRILITQDGVEIIGLGRPTIQMTGLTKTYLDSIDDLSSSGRDVFTVFSFMRVSGSVQGIDFEGEWDGVGEFRYASPRAKAIGFIGSPSGYVADCTGTGILGNLVNVTPSDNTIDGAYQPAYDVTVENCRAVQCLENGFNSMGNTFRTRFINCDGSLCGSTGIENGATDGLISGGYLTANKKAGFSLSGTNPVAQGVRSIANTNAGELATDSFGAIVAGVGAKVLDCDISDNESFGITIYPGATRPTIRGCRIRGNGTSGAATSAVNAVGASGNEITDLIFEGNDIDQDGETITHVLNVNYVLGARIRYNKVRGTTATNAVVVQSTSTDVEAHDNDVNRPVSIAGATNLKWNNAGDSKRTVEGTAAPTTGTWAVGDRVLNTSTTAAGAALGWICTVAGTPGTWRVIGFVESPALPTANLADTANAINTTNKFIGKSVWDTTVSKPKWAAGPSTTSAWKEPAIILSATATLDFPSVAAGASQELTVTVTGAAVGDTVYLGAPAAIEAGLVWNGYVSATNTVKVRVTNVTGSAIDPASATWKVTVAS